ncbi:hypothetical protein B0A49_11310 [Cryomyces minteri]|uniref:Exoribonuclease phosphorolytic domain-containing protein n=1 Tax=Cryomyces minteri TaxID=331657 RepID=A0A4U0WI07_9PEZI|nr:hypothetical protein B0A49_11310 [Cryomyces minteri]
MTDRRRINGPRGGTNPPIFASSLTSPSTLQATRPTRTRQPDELRKIYLKTGLAPSASGSAYLELTPSSPASHQANSLIPVSSSLKLTCTVHGPRPLPRSAPFTPHLLLTTHVKFAPFAARQRRGYTRDASERDLGVHLETALRGVIIGERWPKSGVEVIITVLEGEEDRWWGDEVGAGSNGVGAGGGWGMMNVLAGCITVASAAIVDAGIDCVDMVAGGVAAIVGNSNARRKRQLETAEDRQTVLDPCPSEHENLEAACVVGYLQNRDEITELWVTGNAGTATEDLIDRAIDAANAARGVLVEAIKEAAQSKFGIKDADNGEKKSTAATQDVEMAG